MINGFTLMIYCCNCEKEVSARLTDGKEIYPHRSDLANLPFWKCDSCDSYVGCHHKTKNRTRPLGVIASKEIKNARVHIHRVLDPIWKSGACSRRKLYKLLSDKLGYQYHTAEIKTINEARHVYRVIIDLKKELKSKEVA